LAGNKNSQRKMQHFRKWSAAILTSSPDNIFPEDVKQVKNYVVTDLKRAPKIFLAKMKAH